VDPETPEPPSSTSGAASTGISPAGPAPTPRRSLSTSTRPGSSSTTASSTRCWQKRRPLSPSSPRPASSTASATRRGPDRAPLGDPGKVPGQHGPAPSATASASGRGARRWPRGSASTATRPSTPSSPGSTPGRGPNATPCSVRTWPPASHAAGTPEGTPPRPSSAIRRTRPCRATRPAGTSPRPGRAMPSGAQGHQVLRAIRCSGPSGAQGHQVLRAIRCSGSLTCRHAHRQLHAGRADEGVRGSDGRQRASMLLAVAARGVAQWPVRAWHAVRAPRPWLGELPALSGGDLRARSGRLSSSGALRRGARRPAGGRPRGRP
jgi:hypothetical protein